MLDTDDGFPKINVRKTKQTLFFEQIRPQVRRFAHMMEMKFRIHDEERGDPYQNSSLVFLEDRLRQEMREFRDCIFNNKSLSEWEKEGADVGNIMTMLIEWKRNSYKKGWGKP